MRIELVYKEYIVFLVLSMEKVYHVYRGDQIEKDGVHYLPDRP